MFELQIEDTFDAAHALRGYDGPCENLHGHTWRVQVFFRGDKLNDLGILIDFKTVKKLLKELLDQYDHKNMNELVEFNASNPSSENLAKSIYLQLQPQLKGLNKVTVWESATTAASYQP
ncbi:6-carboxytetrahydropterin synthase QueD [candidate division WOR-1 bacterium RIFOXYB2_FULL_48_7]|uniref:6-carboxy-5,6,7,8-tetrahydropterin synthase n=1 Tax=candidate division WOR-1 bacterium RIFOXYB2_FULL_48_7 TaxID=1802583 RepID=A0A1F4TSC1_UNCSA|nr:MAG: 6-carboxytetrahydropterin synthase QueD [candidate division WOR-1 bacterium RIFOXYB2_FULL_48_7]